MEVLSSLVIPLLSHPAIQLEGVSDFWTVSEMVIADHMAVESCYENAEEFVPERWFSKPEMIKYKGAFAPFSLGKIA